MMRGELDPAQVRQVIAEATAGLDTRWYNGAPDLSESPLAYKDAARVKAQMPPSAWQRWSARSSPRLYHDRRYA